MQRENYPSDNEEFLNRLFSRHVGSSIVSMFGALASGTANSILAGLFFGAEGLSVMSLVAPFYALFAAFGSLVGVGGATAAAYAMGRGDKEEADAVFTLSAFIGFFVPLVVGILCCRSVDFWLKMAGCSEVLLECARSYALVYFLGGFGTSIFYIPFNFLKLVGKLRLLMIIFLGMAVANTILDIVFVKFFGIGLAGIALGTVAASVGTSIVGMFFLVRGDDGFCLTRRFYGRLALSVTKLGTPSALNQLLNFIRLILMNRIIVAVAGDVGLAAFSVFSALERLSLVILSGLAQSTSSFVSVFTKEKDTASVRRIEKRAHILGAALILPVTALIFLFPAEICQMFGLTGGEKLAVATRAVWLFAFSLPPSLCAFLMFFYYQAAGFTALANVLIFCRSFLFLVGTAYLLAPIWGADAVWWSLTIASIVPLFIIPMVMPYYSRRGYRGLLLLDTDAETNGRYLSCAVRADTESIIDSVDQIGEFCTANNLSGKETMLVRLSMEEMLMSIKDHCFKENSHETMDVRILIVKKPDDTMIILRIRNGGRLFNPIDYYERMEKDDPYQLGDALGIAMIVKAADAIHYKTTFGINNLTVIIDGK